MDQTPKSAVGQTTDEVGRLFAARGADWYGGEAVSQLQHALQAAMFAECDGAPAELIVAALLHDVGHLLHDLPEDAANHGLDDRHERLGGKWVRLRFGAAVVDPVTMHVAAKRYLCAVDESYAGQLSPASQQSLRLQGGAMSAEEIAAFQQQPHFAAAVQLRRWDDAAKVVDLKTPPLAHFLPYLQEAAQE